MSSGYISLVELEKTIIVWYLILLVEEDLQELNKYNI